MNPRQQFLDYEIQSARWWVGWIGSSQLQHLVARYFVWKVNRKYAAYRNGLAIQARLKQIDDFRAARQRAEKL